MTIKTFIPGLLTVASLTGAAPADFESASVEDVSASLGTPPGLTTWRVYVNFDDPDDVLWAISANADASPLEFETDAPGGLVNLGGSFDGLWQEDFAQFPVSEAWDSWITIDHDESAGNDTNYSPGFLGSDGVHAVIVGSEWSHEQNGGWYDSNPGTPADAGGDFRVLIAQFTIAEGYEFTLRGTADYQRPGGGNHSESFFVDTNNPITVTNVVRSTCPPTDMDGDGATDFTDLLHVLGAWGTCTYDYELTAQDRSIRSFGRECNDDCEECFSWSTTIRALGYGRFRISSRIDSVLGDDRLALSGWCSQWCSCAGGESYGESTDIRLEFQVHAPLPFGFVAEMLNYDYFNFIHVTGPAGFDLNAPVDTTGILTPGHYVLTVAAEAYEGYDCSGFHNDFDCVLDLDGTRCAADVDRNGTVDAEDVRRILEGWGPCTESGACCLQDGTCTEDLTYEDCVAAGGTHMGWGTWCDTVDCPE